VSLILHFHNSNLNTSIIL